MIFQIGLKKNKLFITLKKKILKNFNKEPDTHIVFKDKKIR